MQGTDQDIEVTSYSHYTSVEDIKNLVSEEFLAVNELIINHLYSEISLIQNINEHIITSGGKRLRPLVVLLAAKTFDYQGSDHIALAAVIEFIHTATLLHDDVVDNSSMRRGRRTANTIWGNAASILVGDFLYSRTFQILTRLKNIHVMDLLAKTTNAIAEGEVLQLLNRNNPNTTEEQYMKVIQNKTAKLFEAATEVGALLCDRSAKEQQAMACYGHHLGMAFQLVDDALDYSGKSQELGKNLGDDLAEGKPTLPLIHAMRYTSAEKADIIRTAIKEGGLDKLGIILSALHETKALDYTLKKAKDQVMLAHAALNGISDSPFRTALQALAHFAVFRNY